MTEFLVVQAIQIFPGEFPNQKDRKSCLGSKKDMYNSQRLNAHKNVRSIRYQGHWPITKFIMNKTTYLQKQQNILCISYKLLYKMKRKKMFRGFILRRHFAITLLKISESIPLDPEIVNLIM